jgi:hypothetical protein
MFNFPFFLKIIRTSSLISLIALASLQHVKANVQTKVLFRVCKGNTDFLPYMNMQGTGKWQQLIAKASASLPIEVAIHEVPRGRCVVEVQNNTLSDGYFAEPSSDTKTSISFPMTSKNELDKSYVIDRLAYFIVVNKDSNLKWNGKNFDDLKNKLFGVQRGRKFITDILDQKNIPYDISIIEHNFEKLKMNRVSGVIIELPQYDALRKKHPEYDFKVLPTQIATFDIYLGVATPFYKKNKKLIDKLWLNMKLQRKT